MSKEKEKGMKQEEKNKEEFNLSHHAFPKRKKVAEAEKESQNISENSPASDSQKDEESVEDIENIKNCSLLEPEEQISLSKEEESYKEKNLRLQADFDNFRKRTRKERIDALQYGNQDIILDILDVIDNFERALQSAQSEKNLNNITKGIAMIQEQLMQVIKRKGVEKMTVEGEIFDPHLHEAISFEEIEEKEKDGIILEELQRGYKLHEKMIRVPKVKVSKYKEN